MFIGKSLRGILRRYWKLHWFHEVAEVEGEQTPMQGVRELITISFSAEASYSTGKAKYNERVRRHQFPFMIIKLNLIILIHTSNSQNPKRSVKSNTI